MRFYHLITKTNHKSNWQTKNLAQEFKCKYDDVISMLPSNSFFKQLNHPSPHAMLGSRIQTTQCGMWPVLKLIFQYWVWLSCDY